MAWSDLLKRVWNVDGLRCLKCSGRMLVVGVVKDPDVIEAILAAISMSEAMRDGAASSPRQVRKHDRGVLSRQHRARRRRWAAIRRRATRSPA